MQQLSFCELEYKTRKKKTKREEFLDIMESIIPWDEWVSIVTPYYPTGKRGRPPIEIEKMLRMYLLQSWFNLSDEAVEDAIYDSYAMRKFMKINVVDNGVPDATTLLKFRHLLEDNRIGKRFFDAIKQCLENAGRMMRGGTIVDATLINAPSSTKNADKKRDPEMHQTKKGNQWYFGMKCHAGMDAGSGFVHTIEATPANVHDITVAPKLLREDDRVVYGDSAYMGLLKRAEIMENDNLNGIECRINLRPRSLPKMPDGFINWEREIEKRKSAVRCKVEHAFRIVKNIFGYHKTVYKGIRKNLNRLHVLFASANLYMLVKAGGTL